MDDLLYTKRELPKFLKRLQPGDPVSLYALAGPTVKVIHEFSANAESLVSAERISSSVAQWLSSAKDPPKNKDKHISNEWTLSALESIALHLADIPGRKTLVWVSSAFPLNLGFENTEAVAQGASNPTNGDLDSYYQRVKRLAKILNCVNVSIYPVDPKGLAIDDQYKAGALSESVADRTLTGLNNVRLRTQHEDRAGEFATMDLIALETGGRAFYNANALGESIQRSVDDSRVTYLLGFYPEETSWDGKNHRLEVRVNRPGVQVRFRHSYFAGDPRVESAPERESALQTAASSALNGTAIGLTLNVATNPLKPGAQQIEISVASKDLRFENKQDTWRTDFDLVLAQVAPDGRRLAGARSQCILDRNTFAETQTKPVSIRRDITIDPAASSLRVLVRDSSNGAIGSLEVPIGH